MALSPPWGSSGLPGGSCWGSSSVCSASSSASPSLSSILSPSIASTSSSGTLSFLLSSRGESFGASHVYAPTRRNLILFPIRSSPFTSGPVVSTDNTPALGNCPFLAFKRRCGADLAPDCWHILQSLLNGTCPCFTCCSHDMGLSWTGLSWHFLTTSFASSFIKPGTHRLRLFESWTLSWDLPLASGFLSSGTLISTFPPIVVGFMQPLPPSSPFQSPWLNLISCRSYISFIFLHWSVHQKETVFGRYSGALGCSRARMIFFHPSPPVFCSSVLASLLMPSSFSSSSFVFSTWTARTYNSSVLKSMTSSCHTFVFSSFRRSLLPNSSPPHSRSGLGP